MAQTLTISLAKTLLMEGAPSILAASAVRIVLPRRAEPTISRAAARSCSSEYWRSFLPSFADVAFAASCSADVAPETAPPSAPVPGLAASLWPDASRALARSADAVADPTAALFEAAPGWSHGTAATAPAGLAPMAWKDCAQPMHRMSARTGGKEWIQGG